MRHDGARRAAPAEAVESTTVIGDAAGSGEVECPEVGEGEGGREGNGHGMDGRII